VATPGPYTAVVYVEHKGVLYGRKIAATLQVAPVAK
jgi:hypothetical protein